MLECASPTRSELVLVVNDTVIGYIKTMSELVNKLKEEKDQVEYKLEQSESQMRCQKMDIESKSLLIKQTVQGRG